MPKYLRAHAIRRLHDGDGWAASCVVEPQRARPERLVRERGLGHVSVPVRVINAAAAPGEVVGRQAGRFGLEDDPNWR
jgi:hypothetical protein